jgi:hypothetical protein
VISKVVSVGNILSNDYLEKLTELKGIIIKEYHLIGYDEGEKRRLYCENEKLRTSVSKS